MLLFLPLLIVEEPAVGGVVVVVAVVNLFAFSRSGFPELFVPVKKFLISDSFVLLA